MRVSKIGLIVGLILLTGCQQIQTRSEYLRDREKDYLKSRLIAPLKVPAGLSEPEENIAYPIPTNIPPLGALEPVSLVPPGFGVLMSQE